jgi:hypothetical protein
VRGVQKRRPSLFDLVDKMKTIKVPTLIITGDEGATYLKTGGFIVPTLHRLMRG